MNTYKITLKCEDLDKEYFINSNSKEEAIESVVDLFLQNVDIEDINTIEVESI